MINLSEWVSLDTMDSLKPSDYYLQALIKANLVETKKILFHRVEHGGFGAIASRLMTGLNISLALEAKHSFVIDSPYRLEEMFAVNTKESTELLQDREVIVWDFLSDTWNAHPQIKANHQYPISPLKECISLSRHQWCSVLAQAILGNPSEKLKNEIERVKKDVGWENYDIHIGLHVRRGDKKSECPYIPNETYVAELTKLIGKHPNKKILVFLSSDDPDTFGHIQSMLVGADLAWDNLEIRYNNFNAGMVANDQALAFQESLTAAKNIYCLGQCQYVVGMRHAQFSWLGGLLSVFNNHLDASRHIMLDPFTGKRSHWAVLYGFPLEELLCD